MTLPRHWLRQVREHRHLTQQTLLDQLQAQDPPCTLPLSHDSRVESGRRFFSELTPRQQEGLRLALDVPVDLWHQVFGTPTTTISAHRPRTLLPEES
ncbi:hypothetical protein [Deinococcus sp. Leaf326]|uniref:hypothetical protein n=1 Tax=Deinococcus sp. Leaf326 TaxID=1736338 RepID=UPI001F436B8B|nr:hypothetical protein [Deinococcus sp. Leaf326]